MKRVQSTGRGALIAAAGTAALLALGCGGASERAPERQNLLLISIDTLRADHLGCYGYERDTSPNLDRLAREGVVFEHAYSTAAWTLPSHASLFTGLYPSEHGVVSTRHRLPDAQTLLPEVLAGLGYRSAGIVSTVPYLRRAYGFRQGWENYDDRSLYTKTRQWQKLSLSAELYKGTLQQLDRLGKGPFFLFVHDYDVHSRYLPPPPFDRRFGPPPSPAPPPKNETWQAQRDRLVPQYDGEIAWVDSWIGKLVDELRRRDLLERTVVAVVSDHGEEFHEHGQWEHNKNLYDSVLHVPWIVRFPGGRHAGTRISTPVSLVDVPATLLALAGRREARWNSGRDVTGWLSPGAAPEPSDIFAFLVPRGDSGQMAIVSDGYKMILRTDLKERPQFPPLGLFRVGVDAGETRDLSAGEGARAAALHRRMEEALAAHLRRQRALPPRSRGKLSQEELESLRALGYL